MAIEPGLGSEVEHTVTEADTAKALGSGDVAVLGTPAVVALFERAAVRALDGTLGASETSVGVRVEIEHLAPTPVGGRVVVEARLEDINGRRLAFSIEARDRSGTVVARGTHSRVVVDRERFVAAALKTQ
jgi:predicted thioesterase